MSVNGGDQLFVARNLEVTMQAERVLLIAMVGVNACNFEADQTYAPGRALAVVGNLAVGGGFVGEPIVNRHRGHYDPVGQLHRADLDGCEE